MSGLEDPRQEFFKAAVTWDDHHLGARHHGVANLHFGYIQCTFHHVQRVGVYDTPQLGFIQEFFELFAVPWLAGRPGRWRRSEAR